MEELAYELNAVGLKLLKHSETLYAVVRKDIANPLLFFDTKNKGDDYNGTIQLKSININLFSSLQILVAIKSVNSYLLE